MEQSNAPDTPQPIKPNLAKLAAVGTPLSDFRKISMTTEGGSEAIMDSEINETELNKEEVADYPPRTVSYPYVTKEPPQFAPRTFDEMSGSCVLQSSLFKPETLETPLGDYVLPLDDNIDPNTYVGDWEEIFIRTYHRVFSQREHQLYWGKCELGIIVTAVAKPIPQHGHPTLSLGPNGYHFAYLPAVPDVEFPNPKQLLKLFPHLEDCKFQYAKDGEKLAHEMLSFEQKMKPTRYKFGLLYIREGQTEENEFYGNLDPSVGFIDFCKRVGVLINLNEHQGYRGGLDCKGGTTGEISLYTTVQLADGRFVNRGVKVPTDAQEVVDLEVMFHVAPFLPHSSSKDDQQLHKKRHLGNDIVVVIYKDGTTKISPDVFKSQFNHVFILVTPCVQAGATPTDKATHYKIEVITKGLKRFLPEIPRSNFIEVGKISDWLLLKCINGEITAMGAKDFRLKMKRTRVQTMESWAKESNPGLLANKKN